MGKEAESNFVKVNGIDLHYLKYANPGKPVIIMLHGLTANARAFEGLVSNGLNKHFELIAPDLRGRGLSSKPLIGYSLKEHAKDILELIGYLQLDQVILLGHSYGGFLSSYLCYYYPALISKVVFLDAAPEMNPKTLQMLQTAMGRLDRIYPNKQAYFDTVGKAPYIDFWDDDMQAYFEADIETFENGTVEPRPDLAQIMQVSFNVGISPLDKYFSGLKQQALLICATGNYTLGEPILPGYLAEKAIGRMKDARVEYVDGNHHTMVYGKYARQIVVMVNKFAGV